MTAAGYRDGVALWSAVASHARTVSKAAGLDTSAVIRRFVFGRFLARRLYPPIARKVPVCSDLTGFADAVALVRTFLAPALDETARSRRWAAHDRRWKPADATTAPPPPAAPQDEVTPSPVQGG